MGTVSVNAVIVTVSVMVGVGAGAEGSEGGVTRSVTRQGGTRGTQRETRGMGSLQNPT